MKKETLAVIVGRFQDAIVCDVMDEFIQDKIQTHDHTLIVVGLSAVVATKHNPLDYEARKLMLREKFPEAEIAYMKDNRCDDTWSKDFDIMVTKFAKRNNVDIIKGIELFGGRYTFINRYTGEFDAEPLPDEIYVNSDDSKNVIASNVKALSSFREGVLWAVNIQYPKVYPTVDIAIHDPKNDRWLLAKKPGETQYRFVGGFVDPTDESYEDAAKREAKEETNLDVFNLRYICTQRIDDWRYRNENDKIMTTFFYAESNGGIFKPQDDIEELRWVNIKNVDYNVIVPEHVGLLNKLLNFK